MIRPRDRAHPVLVLDSVARHWRRGATGRADDAWPTRGIEAVSLALHEGEALVVEAAPGAGGTTLLLLAAGLARPDGGVARAGPDPARVGDRLTFVPTHPSLPGCYTPLDVVHDALSRRVAECGQWRLAAARAPALLAGVGFTDRAMTLPLARLPAVARWQAALAAARASRASVLLVDRPPEPPEAGAPAESVLLAWWAAFARRSHPTSGSSGVAATVVSRAAPAAVAERGAARQARARTGTRDSAPPFWTGPVTDASTAREPALLAVVRPGYPALPGIRRIRLVDGVLAVPPGPRWSPSLR